MGVKLTTADIVKRIKDKFGNKFDCSKVEYVNNRTKICIICPEHGEFWQDPSAIGTSDYLCPKCGREHSNEVSRKQETKTTEQFIEDARMVHGDKYDYSKVNYVNAKTKVCIICPEHGEFWQLPSIHTASGRGCKKCGQNRLIGNNVSRHLTTDEFIERAVKKHGNKFDYSKVKYVDRNTPICIICPKHGEFYTPPSLHLASPNGGCKKCREENLRGCYALTLDDFIKKAHEVHGDKYDYSKVEYVNMSTKVCIICPEHGEFWQEPGNHLRNNGCPECTKILQAKLRTKSTEQFIKEAKEVYGDTYDYSKVEYVKSDVKVCIICPKHGEFWVNPVHFLRGHGCPTCGNNRILTKENFILRAREIHGDKYDYSKVEYVDYNTPVCIICPKHGETWQTPKYHINGAGCRECGVEAVLNAHTYTFEYFLEKAHEVHGDKYDYSKVEYVDTKTKVCIICPEHGEFWQTPGSHIKGTGCPKCYGRNKTTEEFIQEARKVHGDKYDYSKVEYTKARDKVCIICPKHGEFWQTPYSHLKGSGCPKCLGRNRTTEDFIKKAREVHGDKYDYSKVNYVNGKIKIPIICPIHGEFWQAGESHLRGIGCPRCNGRMKLTTDEFIRRAREVHSDKYDYSKVEYVNNEIKVCIVCPEHGEFWQTPHSHLNGAGCPICSHGYTKQYKFNLLKEFESEYSFRAFLANSDINILQVILRNIESKYDPIKKDIERALSNVSSENPIKALEKKYSASEEADDVSWAEESTESINDVDLDDDNAIGRVVKNNNRTHQGVEEMMRNFEEEVNTINRIEHMLTPEDRKYIMEKFLADKRRAWMLEREESVK